MYEAAEKVGKDTGNFSDAFASLETSGWYFFASFLNELLISSCVADLETPSTS
jgi:hypothetical protein